MQPFSVEVVERPPAVVLRMKGEARMDVSPLEAQATALVARRPAMVIVDMAALTFCASIGMRCIFSLRQSLERVGTRTRLAAVHPDVLDAFRRTAILPLFEVYPAIDDALAAPITPSAQPRTKRG